MGETSSLLLYVPSSELTTHFSLDQLINYDFSPSGLKKFENHGVTLRIPDNEDYFLRFRRSELEMKYFNDSKRIVGMKYEFVSFGINEVHASNVAKSSYQGPKVQETIDSSLNHPHLSLTVDLNSRNPRMRYLELRFCLGKGDE